MRGMIRPPYKSKTAVLRLPEIVFFKNKTQPIVLTSFLYFVPSAFSTPEYPSQTGVLNSYIQTFRGSDGKPDKPGLLIPQGGQDFFSKLPYICLCISVRGAILRPDTDRKGRERYGSHTCC
jgi:hypothetical protein